jgi:hypothetical protein
VRDEESRPLSKAKRNADTLLDIEHGATADTAIGESPEQTRKKQKISRTNYSVGDSAERMAAVVQTYRKAPDHDKPLIRALARQFDADCWRAEVVHESQQAQTSCGQE